VIHLSRLDHIASDFDAQHTQVAWLEDADPRAVTAKSNAPAPLSEIGGRRPFSSVKDMYARAPVILHNDRATPSW
jgi:hypothetical protein